MARDSYKSRCYRAERRFWRTRLPDSWERGTVSPDPERNLAKVVAICRAAGLPCYVRDVEMRRGDSAIAWSTLIVLGRGCPSWVLLHEIAHSVTEGNRETEGDRHGLHWRRCYVEIVRAICGAAVADGLASSFRAEGLPMRRGERRPIPPEARAAAAARFSEVREKKRTARAEIESRAELVGVDRRRDWGRLTVRCAGCGRWIHAEEGLEVEVWTIPTERDPLGDGEPGEFLTCSRRHAARAILGARVDRIRGAATAAEAARL